MMKENAVIEEIRKTRESISRECDYSPEKLVDYYLKRQKKRKTAKERPISKRK